MQKSHNIASPKTRAVADWRLVKDAPEIVFISDMNLGGTSITNDAEAVVHDVVAIFGNKRVVYRDTMGNWDELTHLHGVFSDFVAFTGELP